MIMELVVHYSTGIILIGNLILAACVVLLIAAISRGLADSKKIEEISSRIVAFSKNNEKTRYDKEKQRQILEGATNEETFLYRLDKKIARSGLKELSPNITTEMVLAGLLAVTSVLVVMGGILCGIKGIIVGALVGVILPYGIITYRAKKRYHQLDNQLLSFMNLIDNYSKMSDDIIEIFGKIYRYLDPPLSGLLEECYSQTMMTGNPELCLRELTDRMGHEKIKEIIDNIEIASRHEADYSVVINDEREIINNYLFDKKEKQSLINSARVECLILLGLGAALVYMLCDGFGASVSSLYDGKTASSLAVIAATAATGFYAVKSLLFAK